MAQLGFSYGVCAPLGQGVGSHVEGLQSTFESQGDSWGLGRAEAGVADVHRPGSGDNRDCEGGPILRASEAKSPGWTGLEAEVEVDWQTEWGRSGLVPSCQRQIAVGDIPAQGRRLRPRLYVGTTQGEIVCRCLKFSRSDQSRKRRAAFVTVEGPR